MTSMDIGMLLFLPVVYPSLTALKGGARSGVHRRNVRPDVRHLVRRPRGEDGLVLRLPGQARPGAPCPASQSQSRCACGEACGLTLM